MVWIGSSPMFPSSYWFNLHYSTPCCISRYAMKHVQKLDCTSDLPFCNYGYHRCVLGWFLCWTHRLFSQLCGWLLSVDLVLLFEDMVQSILNMCVLWCLLCDPLRSSSNHISIEFISPIKKTSHVGPIYLTLHQHRCHVLRGKLWWDWIMQDIHLGHDHMWYTKHKYQGVPNQLAIL